MQRFAAPLEERDAGVEVIGQTRNGEVEAFH
jgi:hypothetical protein